MSLLSKLFGGGGAEKEDKPEIYKQFRIFVTPIKEASGYRLSARIEKEINGALKSHEMVRADTYQSDAEARKYTLLKAQTFIDQMGDDIFR